MRWVVMSRGRFLLLLTMLAVIVLGYWGLRGYTQGGGLEKEALLAAALDNTRASESYRYRINSRLETEGQPTSYFSEIEGAAVLPDRVSIKGTLINSPIELIQIEDTTYMKDQITGRWLTLQGNRLAQSELFITELNPLGVLSFKDVPEISYEGKEGGIGRANEILAIKPLVVNPFLELQFTDFDYRLWIDSKDQRITKAAITAQSKSAKGERLLIDIEFWDYNKEIKIEPPDTEPPAEDEEKEE
ncbi:MAG: hypothetical protein IBX71_04085 [Candidatus Desulforudis sp.]|nr:hypothetical protein [Desulforudis sp.]